MSESKDTVDTVEVTKITSAPAELLSVTATIDTDDMVNIKIAEVEAQLTKVDETIRKRIEEAEQRKQGYESTLSTAKEAFVQAKATKALQNVAGTLANLFGRPTISQRAEWTLNNNSVQIFGCLRFGYGGEISTEKPIFEGPPSSEIVTAAASVKIEEAKIEHLRQRAVEVRKKLTNMGAMERQVKGAVARHKVEQTAEGQQLLQKMDALTLIDINVTEFLPAGDTASN